MTHANPPPSFDWNDIPLLLALAKLGSMSAASRKLGMDKSTISRRVAATEAALGARLFIRSNLGYQPTDAGQALLRHAGSAYEAVQSLLLATRETSEAVSGPVRLTAVDGYFDYWLLDRLPQLLADYPDVEVALIADNENLSFGRREADFALRMAEPMEDAALVRRRIGTVGSAVYGAGPYAGVSRNAWREQPWLSYSPDLSQLPEVQWLQQLDPVRPPVLRVNSTTTLIRACEAGLGLALLPCLAADRCRLTRLSEQPEQLRELWLLGHRDATRIRRFQVVGDWLANALKAESEKLAGTRLP